MPAGLWEETWVQGENMNIQSYHLGSNLWHSYSNAKTQSLCQRAAQDSWHILKIKKVEFADNNFRMEICTGREGNMLYFPYYD